MSSRCITLQVEVPLELYEFLVRHLATHQPARVVAEKLLNRSLYKAQRNHIKHYVSTGRVR